MATSSLLGIDRVPRQAPGRDDEALGPGDSSDSGSDVAGLDELGGGDPSVPVDVALRDDVAGLDTDTTGSGERRSAAGDAGEEAADIGTDRIESVAPDGDEDLDGEDEDVLEDATDDAEDPDAEDDDPDKV